MQSWNVRFHFEWQVLSNLLLESFENWFKMISQNQSLDVVRQKFVKNHLELTALIQVILFYF